MIRKLRTKIIVYSFISVCVVFMMGLAVLFGIGYSRLNDERVVRLNNEFVIDDWHTVSPSSISGIVLAEYDIEQDNISLKVVGDGIKQTESETDDILKRIITRRFDEGLIGINVVYTKRIDGTVMRIAYMDRGFNSSKDVKYAVYSVVALFVGSIAYLIICNFLAHLALKPVEVTWKRQKQFVADASHELKTPLSVIKANTELIAAHSKDTVASQMKWVDNTRFEVERMTALVNDLLFLAKNDEGLKEQLDTVNFSECVTSVVLAQEVLLYEKGKVFDYDIAPNLSVLGNDGQLKQLVTILLDNANKYSKGEGNIRLTLSVASSIVGKIAELKVSNDCEYITPEQLEHLFDRFYMIDQSRDKSHTGTGLGLAIAQTICENHEGEITASFADGRITFTAQLPIYRPTLLGK